MNRRYDDAIKFIASIVFGSSFKLFHDVIKTLEKQDPSSNNKVVDVFGLWHVYHHFIPLFSTSAWTTCVFFAVFFRNVHGLIAYDLWADHSKYRPSFEQRPKDIVRNFVFGLLGAILLPYLFIYIVAGHADETSVTNRPGWIALFLFAPMAVYFPWNVLWLWKLKQSPLKSLSGYQRSFSINKRLSWPIQFRAWFLIRLNGLIDKIHGWIQAKCSRFPKKVETSASKQEYHAYVEILHFTILWFVLDLILFLFLAAFLLLKPVHISDYCIVYINAALLILLFDYCFHVEYYFPTPVPPSEYYEFTDIWDHVLPNGSKFCHWGGESSSIELVSLLGVQPNDAVLELCCGRGGTLNLLPPARDIVGVDISELALDGCRKYLRAKPIKLLRADISQMALPANYFTKIFVQDGDAWMHPRKGLLMAEVFRVLEPNGIFVYQSYVRTSLLEGEALVKTKRLLADCGYRYTDVPLREKIPEMFEKAGFHLEGTINDLHDIYAHDNLEMLNRFHLKRETVLRKFPSEEVNSIGRLLEWEKELFFRKWWSGIRVIARKPLHPVLDIS